MAEKKKKGIGRLLFGLTARTFMLMNAVVLVFSYLSMYVNPAKAWFMTIFGVLFIVFFIMNLLLLVWALRRRSGSAVIPLGPPAFRFPDRTLCPVLGPQRYRR